MKAPARASLASMPVLPAKGTAAQTEPLPSSIPSPVPEPPREQPREQPREPTPPAQPPAVDAGPLLVPTPVGPPPREGTVSMNLRMPPALQRKLKMKAFQTGEPATQIILAAVRAYIGHEDE